MFKLFANFFKKPSKKQSFNLDTITSGKSTQKCHWICVKISLPNETKYKKYAMLSLGFPNIKLTKKEHIDLQNIIAKNLNNGNIKILGEKQQSYSKCLKEQSTFAFDFAFSSVRVLCKIDDTSKKIVSYRYNNENENKEEVHLKTPIKLMSNEDKKVKSKSQIKI